MLPRPLLALTMVAALCSFAPKTWGSPPAASQPPVEPKEVRTWLLRIHEAASRRNFQGTFIVSAGGAVSSARIAHYCDGSGQFERIDSLDGQARHVFRHNTVVHTIWPQQRVATVEQRDVLSSFPGLLQGSEGRIADFYELRPQGTDRVAGHEASVLLLNPRDSHRFGYRLWAEKASGLLLRADVLGERGELLETSAFSDVAIDVKPQTEAVLRSMQKLDGYQVVRPTFKPTNLEAEGWTLRQAVPGFRQVSCVKRPMEAFAAGEGANRPIEAVQSIFSDGLTHVSVFIEPFDAQRHTDPVLSALGATRTLMRRKGDWWITVVGDVPAATLDAFAVGLERKK
jgi:sigma-E factor negative regulatory protein RseB